MNIAKCRWCGNSVDPFSYQNRLFCSNKCKMAFSRRKRAKTPKKQLKGVTGTGKVSNEQTS